MQRRLATTAAILALALVGAACSSDDGADVRTLNSEEAGSGSASGSGSGSGSASGVAPSPVGTPGDVPEVDEDGGYAYASDVNSHRLVTLDVCDVIAAMDADPVDVAAAAAAYRDGGNSPSGDGVRTLAGFATATDRLHGLDDHFDSATPLDDVVSAALDGTGVFDGEPTAVRAQGIEKGIQNQVLVAWVLHELAAALDKAADGNFDPAEGAVHNWDEAWAFYHGAAPDCAPYATANKRAIDFGTTGDGEVALANAAILDAMIRGRDALLDEDADTAATAADEIRRALVITYTQATIKYATLVVDDLAARDADTARVHQAEGWAFFRVVEPLLADAGADVDAVTAILHLDNEPGSGDGEDVRTALQPALDSLGITSDDIGELSS